MIRVALLFVLAAPPAAADPITSSDRLLAYHRSACDAQGGTLTMSDAARRPAFVSGPEDPALLIDTSKLACSTAPAMFCGEGVGCELNVFVGDAQHSLIVLDWSLVPDDDRQLLQVTIAGELINKPEPGTFRMTWDSATNGLVTVD
jgi:hypothetical protein